MILIKIDDIIEEIGMIKRILLNQSGVFKMLRQAIQGKENHEGKKEQHNDYEPFLPCLETSSRLETEAERVRSMVCISMLLQNYKLFFF
jgi:hypothetical protein